LAEAIVTRGLLCTGTLLARRQVAGGVHFLEFRVEAGDGAAPPEPRPGQFFQFDCGGGREHLLRRPLSVHGVTEAGDGLLIQFLVEVVGWGTGRLCSLEKGERVGMLGPLGNGFTIAGQGRFLLVAGGIGMGPMFFLAREMDLSGAEYDFLAGFRSGELTYGPLDGLAGRVEVFTEDGSAGTGGLVSDGVEGRLERDYLAAYACGPEGMMVKVAALCEDAGVPCQVSLDSRMACGIGACRGCVKEGTAGRRLCVCTDGPVFDSSEVAWKGVRS
jgi:dihydroorotate dehydrogenase electron transfer subunit